MIFLLFLCLQIVSSQDIKPEIIDFSQDLVKDVAETVDLSCTVKNLQDYNIVWNKQSTSQIQLSVNANKLLPDNRISVTLDRNGDTVKYRLTIKNIAAKDFGAYKCSIPLDTSEEVAKQINLQVRSPPVIYANSTTAMTSIVGNSTKLECYSGGYPIPDIEWRKANDGILPTGGTEFKGNVLKFPNIQKEHAGVYYCIADNGVGKSKKSFNLTVEYPPIVTAAKTSVGQALTFSTELECRVDSSPASEITWLRDNSRINSNQYYSIKTFATNDNYTTSKLEIKVEERKLYGDYVCQALNRLGKGHVSINFHETKDQVCAGICTSGSSVLSFVELKWSVTSIILLMYWI